MYWPQEFLRLPEKVSEAALAAASRLANAHAAGKLAHAVMIVGPVGLGRELAAFEAARRILCRGTSSQSCSCRSCRKIAKQVHPDFVVIKGTGKSSRISIDQVRELRQMCARVPVEGTRSVWVLDGVEAGKLGPEAANALLKTLEEPPLHAMFLLLAENEHAVLPTIRSRCQVVRLPSRAAITLALSGDVAKLDEEGRQALDEWLSGDRLWGAMALTGYVVRGGPESAASVYHALAMEALRRGEPVLLEVAESLMEAERKARVLNMSAHRQLLSVLLSPEFEIHGA